MIAVARFIALKVLVLHFGRLRCGSQTGICIRGRCLHQIYGRKGGQYRLLNNYYGPNDD
jgi:hypothetical protein